MTTRLTTRGFHHITMVSSSATRTLSFYRDLLGLSLTKKTVNFDDPSAYHLYFGSEGGQPGTILTFFEWPHARKGQWGAGGVHHLALGVSTLDGLLKWKRRLADAGVPSNGPIDRGYFFRCTSPTQTVRSWRSRPLAPATRSTSPLTPSGSSS